MSPTSRIAIGCRAAAITVTARSMSASVVMLLLSSSFLHCDDVLIVAVHRHLLAHLQVDALKVQ